MSKPQTPIENRCFVVTVEDANGNQEHLNVTLAEIEDEDTKLALLDLKINGTYRTGGGAAPIFEYMRTA